MTLKNATPGVWSTHVAVLSLATLTALASSCARNAQQDDTTANQSTSGDTTSQADTGGGDDDDDGSLADVVGRGAGEGECELAPVYFAYDQSELDSSARAQLVSNARCIESTRPSRVAVVGMTDARGTTEYNLSLGDRRAHVAAAFVVAQGVSSSLLEVRSVGEEFATGTEETSWVRDRRAEFQIDPLRPSIPNR